MKKSFIRRDKSYILEKTKEAFSSVLPVTVIVLVLSFILVPVNNEHFLTFICGSALVIVGIGLFTLGADIGMSPIGNYIGSSTLRSGKKWLIVLVFFVVGTLITICEPDLQVLSNNIGNSVNVWVLLISIGVGVGLFLVVAVFKILFKIKLSYILIASYTIIFALSAFVPENFIPLSFDSSGVTTGPMSVPFIIAIGTGISTIRSDGKDPDEGLGLTALCSIGPIIAVMIIGIIFHPENISAEETAGYIINNSQDLIISLGKEIVSSVIRVSLSLSPIVVFFLVFRFFGKHITASETLRILVGVLYTYVGMILFMTGVNFGFSTIGAQMGEMLGKSDYNFIVVPIGFLLGFFAVAAEPAVHVLVKQVYEITDGGIPKKVLSYSLMIGVGIAVALAFLRIICHINIYWFLIPVYFIALLLTFFVPNIFTAIAFDSGGVASGAMTASFILPMALGLCKSVGGNIATEGFGVVAMVAMTPLLTIQIMGLVFKIKVSIIKKRAEKEKPASEEKKEKIID